ncbi:hypothetical protein MNBD_GAMMA15-812 [hydrothermal vent metagenome]|uniref:Carboxypeptidase regulatory-like domain-containing protein n=1 Tax=hydrothermal vent metagenome TaxID=652676 RepID=A0A3B0Y2P9_9ZZZZ
MSGIVQRRAVTRLLSLRPLLVFLLTLFMQPVAALGVYVSRSIEGSIIDATTNTPIDGVIVTASWMQSPTMGHGALRPLNVSETVTNAKGEYTLPGWGPRFYADILENDQPVVRFFKPSYVPLVIANNSVYHPGLEGDRAHLINKPELRPDGKVRVRYFEPEAHQVKFGKKKHAFKLVPFRGTDEEYRELVRDKYVWSLRSITSGDACKWKQLPITFTTLHKLSIRLGLPKNRGIFFVSYLGGQDRCGSAEEYFKEYLK